MQLIDRKLHSIILYLLGVRIMEVALYTEAQTKALLKRHAKHMQERIATCKV